MALTRLEFETPAAPSGWTITDGATWGLGLAGASQTAGMRSPLPLRPRTRVSTEGRLSFFSKSTVSGAGFETSSENVSRSRKASRALSRLRSEEHTSELQSRSDLVCR